MKNYIEAALSAVSMRDYEFAELYMGRAKDMAVSSSERNHLRRAINELESLKLSQSNDTQ